MQDVGFTLSELSNLSDECGQVEDMIMGFKDSHRLEFVSHGWWTSSFSYQNMKTHAPDLYASLSSSDLVIFKGDLNYRKLVGDVACPPTVSFRDALGSLVDGGMKIVALRTNKSDVIVGLEEGVAETVAMIDSKWMVNGQFGVIQTINL